MGIFGEGHEEKEKDAIIFRLLTIIENLTDDKKKPHPVHLVLLTKSINNSILNIMALSLAANQEVTGQLGLVDSTTQAAVTATFTNATFVSSDSTIFTAAADATNPNQVDIVAVAAGTANLIATATASYTDSTGAVQTNAPETVTIPVTVVAVVTADGVSLVVNFGAPTLQPAPTPPATPAS